MKKLETKIENTKSLFTFVNILKFIVMCIVFYVLYLQFNS